MVGAHRGRVAAALPGMGAGAARWGCQRHWWGVGGGSSSVLAAEPQVGQRGPPSLPRVRLSRARLTGQMVVISQELLRPQAASHPVRPGNERGKQTNAHAGHAPEHRAVAGRSLGLQRCALGPGWVCALTGAQETDAPSPPPGQGLIPGVPSRLGTPGVLSGAGALLQPGVCAPAPAAGQAGKPSGGKRLLFLFFLHSPWIEPRVRRQEGTMRTLTVQEVCF